MMNCFRLKTTKKGMKKLEKTGVLTIPIFRRRPIPREGDRIFFDNFNQVFSIEKIMVARDEEDLIRERIGDETRPYLIGFFDLFVRHLYDDFKIMDIAELAEDGRYKELVSVASGACDLYAKFETAIAVVEAESERLEKRASKVSNVTIEEEVRKRAEEDFYREILQKTFNDCWHKATRKFVSRYDPIVACIDGYHPLAMMLFYWEYDPENEEMEESIQAAYVNERLASSFGLTIDDIRYVVEELFVKVLMGFDPNTPEDRLKKPTIIAPIGQAAYFKNLVEHGEWSITGGRDFGYVVYN